MDNLPIFIGVTAAAIVLQACVLVGMYLAVRKSSAQVEAIATEVKTKVLPTAEIAHSMILELRPKIETVVSNVSEASTLIRGQLERIDATVADIVDRARLQVIRADEMVGHTMDRIEETRDAVTKTVVSPVRQISGLVHGITTGFETFFGGRRYRGNGGSVAPQDEMFI
jgi:methyl-accepting chemotaxis protein